MTEPTVHLEPTPSMVIRAASEMFGVSEDDILGPRRTQHLMRARQVAMHAAREMTKWSYPALGRAFGGRDHTTIIDGVRRVDRDPSMRALSRRVVQQLSPPPQLFGGGG